MFIVHRLRKKRGDNHYLISTSQLTPTPGIKRHSSFLCDKVYTCFFPSLHRLFFWMAAICPKIAKRQRKIANLQEELSRLERKRCAKGLNPLPSPSTTDTGQFRSRELSKGPFGPWLLPLFGNISFGKWGSPLLPLKVLSCCVSQGGRAHLGYTLEQIFSREIFPFSWVSPLR